MGKEATDGRGGEAEVCWKAGVGRAGRERASGVSVLGGVPGSGLEGGGEERFWGPGGKGSGSLQGRQGGREPGASEGKESCRREGRREGARRVV